MERRLIIVGASAMGREVFHYAEECIGVNAAWKLVAGFLDDRTHILDSYQGYPAIMGSVENYQPKEDELYVCCIGDPLHRLAFTKKLLDQGACFSSVVHPRAYVGKNVKIGDGSVICPGAVVTADSHLGRHVIVNVNASISHDCEVGDCTTVSPGCTIAGWCKIGAQVFMGVQSAVLPGVTIAHNVVLGAGAVAIRDVAEPGTYVGCPAKRLSKTRNAE